MSDANTETPEGNTPADATAELRAIVAKAHGLPEAAAARLQGSTLGELTSDANALAAMFTPPAPEPEQKPEEKPEEKPSDVADLSSLTDAQREALTAAGVDLAALGVVETIAPQGQRRDPYVGSGGYTRAQIKAMSTAELNRALENGTIDLSRVSR